MLLRGVKNNLFLGKRVKSFTFVGLYLSSIDVLRSKFMCCIRFDSARQRPCAPESARFSLALSKRHARNVVDV